MPLYHFGGVIVNMSAAYTHTETTCWFGWLSGKTYGNKIVQSGWKKSQVCLQLLKVFHQLGLKGATSTPQVPNSSHEHLFLHCTLLSVHCSSSKNQHHLQTSSVASSSCCEPAFCSPKPLKSSQFTHPSRLFFREESALMDTSHKVALNPPTLKRRRIRGNQILYH